MHRGAPVLILLSNVSPQQATYNPRKESLMKLKLHLTEQDNKCMLQRISRILTAAPSINDDDYLKMKKLIDTRGPSHELFFTLFSVHDSFAPPPPTHTQDGTSPTTRTWS